MTTPIYAPCPDCGCPDYYGPATIVYQGAHVVYVECRGCQIRRLPVYAVKPGTTLAGWGPPNGEDTTAAAAGDGDRPDSAAAGPRWRDDSCDMRR
jgi:hypothetical protein